MSNNNLKIRSSYSGATLIEILLCFAILSASLYPIAFLFQHIGIDDRNSKKEFLATLLAHHATETLIAKRSLDASYVPQIANRMPVAMQTDSPLVPHEYFKAITPNGNCITNLNKPKIFNEIKDFTFSIATYLIDTRFYTAICTIHYSEKGKQKQVFFQRLLYGINKNPDELNDNEYENIQEATDDFSYDDGNLNDE